jgi:CO dehydrogenase nickel-insertion accessory protein CooC1
MYLVANRVKDEAELAFLRDAELDLPLIGHLPEDARVQEADRLGIPVHEHVPALKAASADLRQRLEATNGRTP